MSDHPATRLLQEDFAELEAEARAWFADSDDERQAIERAMPALLGSTLLELERPDRLNLDRVRVVARLPAAWDNAQVLACVALAAVRSGADDCNDEAYALRYCGAARSALHLADNVDASNEQKRALTAAHEARAFERLQDVALAFERLHGKPWKQKKAAIATELKLSEKSVERLHAEARALGLSMGPVDPLPR